MDLIKNRDFVIIGLQSWDLEIGSNCKNLALEISKHNRVLYVNRPLDRKSYFLHRNKDFVKRRIEVLNKKEPQLEKINKNLWIYDPRVILESINWIKNKYLHRLLLKHNNKKLFKRIDELLQYLNFENIIILNDNDFINYYFLKDYLKNNIYIYYLRDNLTFQDYFKKRAYLETSLFQKVDLINANSQYLAEYSAKYNQKSYYIGQGCDFEDINEPTPLPNDLMNIKNIKIGYVGTLSHERLDIKLIEYIAKYLPQYNFILVGPEDEVFKDSRLHDIDNIYFLGAKEPKEVKKYINNFDVCINPQIINDLTIGNYPRKIDEYLAWGKAVVATHTITMQAFKDYVYLANDYKEFAFLIEKALIENNEEKHKNRRNFALTHTWSNSVKEMYKSVIDNYYTI